MRPLEEFTLDVQWKLFLEACPPPKELPLETVECYKCFFAAGVGSMMMFARRLESEPTERRAAIYAQIEKDYQNLTGGRSQS